MANRTVIPFGPQHPVLPEPLHLDLELDDEIIVDAIPSIGYIHRGLELLVAKRDYQTFTYVAERICGICSFMHGMGYCLAVEKVMGVVVPRRADFIRVVYCELSRVHSHLLWLGLAADAFGFEQLFMQTWKARELVLDLVEATAGARVIFGNCKIGGVRHDLSADQSALMIKVLNGMRHELHQLCQIFLTDITVRERLSGLGCLDQETARLTGAVGPMLRASGVAYDARHLGYAAYNELEVKPIVATSGDCLGRVEVRVGEIFQSIDLIEKSLTMMPSGDVAVKVTGHPKGEAFIRLEQPRGEAVYYVKANGTKNLERFRVRTPTFANVPAVVSLLKGSRLADVPNLILTIDPCISCCER